MSTAIHEAELTIDRHRGVYLVPAEHGSPDDVRDALDGVVRGRLESACREAAAPLLDTNDPAVWFIRDLELELAVGDGLDEDVVACAWGRQIAAAVEATLAPGPDGRNVVRFTDRADHVACFVLDLVAGRARDDWCYADFDGLRSLPLGAAIRESLVREPELTAQALLRVADAGALEQLLEAVGDADAAEILGALESGAAHLGRPPRRESIAALLGPLADIRSEEGLGALAGPKGVLRLLARTRRERPAIARDPASTTAARHLAALVAAVAEPGAGVRLLDALTGAEAATTPRLAGVPEALKGVAWVAEALVGSPELATRAAATLAGISPVAAPAGSAGLRTRYGGAFLLLPSLMAAGAASSAPLRAAVARKCLGRVRSEHATADTAFRLAVGLDGSAGDPPLPEEGPVALLGSCVAALAQAGQIDGRALVPAIVPAGADQPETLVLRDLRRDVWVHAGPAAHVSALSDAAAAARAATGLPFELVREDGVDAPPDLRPALATHAARAKPPATELEHLTSPRSIPPEVDLAVCAVAHAVLREFAGRLPGFEWASGAYLLDNFLAGDDLVRHRRGEIEVVLGPRPLSVILRLGGVDGRTFEAPWLDAPVTLKLEGS